MLYLSIQQASEELRSGLITPTELLAETLERIDQLDGEIKAFITVMREQAYKEAEKAEHEQCTGLFRSPVQGIPTGVEGIIAVRDPHMSACCKALARSIAPDDMADC